MGKEWFSELSFLRDSSVKRAESFPIVSTNGISITCSSCEKAYEIQIDIRKHFRKKTFLMVSIQNGSLPAVSKRWPLSIFRSWLRFPCPRQTFSESDDQIKLVFNLVTRTHQDESLLWFVMSRGVKSAANLPLQPRLWPDIGFYLRSTEDNKIGGEELFLLFYLLPFCFYFVSPSPLLKRMINNRGYSSNAILTSIPNQKPSTRR